MTKFPPETAGWIYFAWAAIAYALYDERYIVHEIIDDNVMAVRKPVKLIKATIRNNNSAYKSFYLSKR